MNKKGSLETKEIIELLLAAAAIVLLIILMVRILDPGVNKNEKAAISYLETLKDQLKEAEKGKEQEFELWQGDFFLVYFDRKNEFEWQEFQFSTFGNHENYICVCWDEDEDKEIVCRQETCASLSKRAIASFEGQEHNWWVVEKQQKVFITLQEKLGEEAYVFEKTKEKELNFLGEYPGKITFFPGKYCKIEFNDKSIGTYSIDFNEDGSIELKWYDANKKDFISVDKDMDDFKKKVKENLIGLCKEEAFVG